MSAEKLVLAFLALLLLTPALPAQKPGDCVVMGSLTIFCYNTFVWYVDPATGKATTVFPPTCGYGNGAAATAAPFNDGVLFCTREMISLTRFQLYHCRPGSVGILATLSSQFTLIPDLHVDQAGDLIALAQTTPASNSGLYRFTAGGGLKSTLATGLAGAVAMEEDLTTGDFVVALGNGDLVRVTRSGKVATIARGALPAGAPGLGGNLHAEPGTGQMLATWKSNVFRLDPVSGAATTLVTGANDFVGLDHDPVNGDYYRTDVKALVRYDPGTGGAVQILGFSSVEIPGDVAAWGSRMLTGAAPPTPGASYPITLAMPALAGRSYQAAAAFATLPGIPTPAGTIHLAPDALFILSMRAPALFVGFAGVLDRNGRAPLAVRIPAAPVLRGLRFFVAAIAYDAGGIRRISEPLGVTIE